MKPDEVAQYNAARGVCDVEHCFAPDCGRFMRADSFSDPDPWNFICIPHGEFLQHAIPGFPRSLQRKGGGEFSLERAPSPATTETSDAT